MAIGRPAIPEAGLEAVAAKTLTTNVTACFFESVTTTEVEPAGVVIGMVKLSPVNEPCGDTTGAGGISVTSAPPTVTDLMVALAVKPVPLRYTVCPAAELPMGVALVDVATTWAPGFRVKAVFTVTAWSVAARVYEPHGRVVGRAHCCGPRSPLVSVGTVQK
jgi:hypothetical protein